MRAVLPLHERARAPQPPAVLFPAHHVDLRHLAGLGQWYLDQAATEGTGPGRTLSSALKRELGALVRRYVEDVQAGISVTQVGGTCHVRFETGPESARYQYSFSVNHR